MNSISPNLNIMIKACEKASKVIIRDFGEVENLQVAKKGPRDFVTKTDKRVEEILIEELSKAKKHYSFLTEESGKIDNKYYAFSVNGRECSGKNPIEWAKEVESRGAGEILLTSIENEGSGKGYNIDLIKQISESVNIRVVANGGAGSIDDLIILFKKTNVDAASMASILHYSLLNKYRNFLAYEEEGSKAFLQSKNFILKNFQNYFIDQIKKDLKKEKINIK